VQFPQLTAVSLKRIVLRFVIRSHSSARVSIRVQRDTYTQTVRGTLVRDTLVRETQLWHPVLDTLVRDTLVHDTIVCDTQLWHPVLDTLVRDTLVDDTQL